MKMNLTLTKDPLINVNYMHPIIIINYIIVYNDNCTKINIIIKYIQ